LGLLKLQLDDLLKATDKRMPIYTCATS